MAQRYNTARWLGPASFLFNFAAQVYGILSEPNMKDVNDANQSFFSPAPPFIAVIFFGQLATQAFWLYKLGRSSPGSVNAKDRRDAELMMGYAPYLIVGNVCIGLWMFAWNSSALKISDLFVLINTAAQLYYTTTVLPPMNRSSQVSMLTHVVSKVFAGLGVLDLLHNTSIAFFKDQPAGVAVKVLTGVGFAAGALASDWIMGATLVYDLVALAAGQSGSWRVFLGAYAVATAALVAVKNVARPPYVREQSEYEVAGQDEEVV